MRGITNRSSGKMGYAIAQAAQESGAKVVLVSGPTALATPQGVQCVDVQSAEQMFDAVKQHVGNCDIFIGVAAVADYRVAQTSAQKIKKSTNNLTLELVPNPDILAYVANLTNPPFCVGFAAESENLAEYAETKTPREKTAAAGGQSGAAGRRQRRQRTGAVRRQRQANAAARRQADAGKAIDAAHRTTH